MCDRASEFILSVAVCVSTIKKCACEVEFILNECMAGVNEQKQPVSLQFQSSRST